jgi:hypothetical protein
MDGGVVKAGSDALDRLAPVARPLLDEVDRALAALGAPAAHPVWATLRRVGATPAEVVRSSAAWDPARLRGAAQVLRQQAQAYAQVPVGPALSWRGSAAAAFAAQATALANHLTAGPGSMLERLGDTAAYAESVAAWFEQTRAAVAAALADVLTSAQAVAMKSSAAGSLAGSATAAADIATYLLDVVAEAIAAGDDLPRIWRARLEQAPFGGAGVPEAAPHSIDVHH